MGAKQPSRGQRPGKTPVHGHGRPRRGEAAAPRHTAVASRTSAAALSGGFLLALGRKEARTWLFNNRRRVWAMFYGSMEVPSRSRR